MPKSRSQRALNYRFLGLTLLIVVCAGGLFFYAQRFQIKRSALALLGAAAGQRVRAFAGEEAWRALLRDTASGVGVELVLADLPGQPGLHQLSISYGADEGSSDRDYIAIEAQYMAALVASGVTVFAASGDAGARHVYIVLKFIGKYEVR